MYSEDCLNLNVYTPLLSSEVNSNQNLPVLIYIHGGSFAYGENSWDRQVSTELLFPSFRRNRHSVNPQKENNQSIPLMNKKLLWLTFNIGWGSTNELGRQFVWGSFRRVYREFNGWFNVNSSGYFN